jgi:nucleoside-diphosphate-sugar epimerase
VAYFYNVYGPRERSGQFNGGYGTVVETFRQNKINNEQSVIYGTGEQVRAFTHVLDTVEALILIAVKGGPDEYAISAAEEFTLNQLAQMFGLAPEHREATRNSRSAGKEDTTKLQALGWQQQHTLEGYIKQTLT